MDRVTKFLAYDGRVSIICANTTKLVDKIRKLHDLTPTTTAALGRFATMSGMMGLTELKGEHESYTIQLKGDGPIGAMISVIKRKEDTSIIKVSIDYPYVELPLNKKGKLDVGEAVGHTGFLNLLKRDELTGTDYNTLLGLASGEIAEDFANYYAKSKQTPTVVALGVLVNRFGVKSAGGYMIQLMPDATEEDISNLERAVEQAPSITTMLSEKKSLEEIARIITGDNQLLMLAHDPKIECDCDCAKEHFEKGIISLGKEELSNMIEEDGKAEVVCKFCHKKYNFSKQELESLLERLIEKEEQAKKIVEDDEEDDDENEENEE